MKKQILLLIVAALGGQAQQAVMYTGQAGAVPVSLTAGSGTLTSVATACGLSGGTITTTGTLRRAEVQNAQTGTTDTIADDDCGKIITYSNAASIAVTLPQANGSTFINGWTVDVSNQGAGTVTITPTTSTIDGAATLVLTTNQGVRIVSNGTNYFSVRGLASGSGISGLTTGKLPKAASSTTLADSIISESGGVATVTGTLAVTAGIASGSSVPTCTAGTGGVWCAKEGTAVAAEAAADNCYADSTAHAIKCSYNNGTATPLARAYGSITTGHCAQFVTATDVEDSGAACGSGASYDPSDRNLTYQIDEFNNFVNNNGVYVWGQLNWQSSYVGTATNPGVNAVAGRLGVLTFTSSAASSSNDTYAFRNSNPVIASQVTGGSGTSWEYIVDVQATTTAKYRLGMSTGIGGGSGWPGGAYHAAMIEFDTSAGDSNWMCVTTNTGGGGQRQSIGVAPTPGTYQRLTITATASNQVSCAVGATSVTNSTSGTMPTSEMVEVIYVGNTTTTSRYMNVDRYQLKFITTGR